MITKQADWQHKDNVKWTRDSNFATINNTDNKKGSPTIVKVRTIQEHFSLKIEKYLRTASFKSNLLVLL